jgi:hypothetical protein
MLIRRILKSRETTHPESSHQTSNNRLYLQSNGTIGGELSQQHNKRNNGSDITDETPGTIANTSDNTQNTSSRLKGALPADVRTSSSTRTCRLQTSVIKRSIASALDGEGKDFLPADDLEDLISEDNVSAVLEEAGIEQTELNDLVKFVLLDAKKTFATLLCIQKVATIQDFLRGGFTDEDLPIGMESGTTENVVSLQPRHNPGSWAMFKTWNLLDISYFRLYQWRFLVPIFDLQSKFEYALEEGRLLPFTKRLDTISSHFSTVHRMIVHPAHINGLVLVSTTAS